MKIVFCIEQIADARKELGEELVESFDRKALIQKLNQEKDPLKIKSSISRISIASSEISRTIVTSLIPELREKLVSKSDLI